MDAGKSNIDRNDTIETIHNFTSYCNHDTIPKDK